MYITIKLYEINVKFFLNDNKTITCSNIRLKTPSPIGQHTKLYIFLHFRPEKHLLLALPASF